MSTERSEADSYIDTISSQTDQGTQTIELAEVDLISVSTSPRLPLPRDFKQIENDTVTVFEFSKTQDSETPQSTANTETEENIICPTKKLSNLKALANRYQYCKDVITPYLDYAEQSLTASQILKDAVDDSREDYSYFNPCLQGFDARKESQITYSSNPISPRVNALNSTNMSDNADEANTSKPPCPVKEQPKQESQSEPEESEPVKYPKPTNRACRKEPELKICFKKGETGQRTNVCPKKEEKKCTPKSNCDKEQITLSNANLVDSFFLRQTGIDKIIDNHIRTVSTIKLAMDDFMDKVCESSKEAIAMIACESVKQLEKLKQTDTIYKCCDHKCRPDTIQLLQDVQSAKEIDLNMNDNFSQALEHFMTSVDSSLSGFNNVVSQNVEMLPKTLKTPKITNNLTIHREFPSAHMFTPDTGSTTAYPTKVFSAIKSRLYSIFSDESTTPALTMVPRPRTDSGKSFETSGATGTATNTNEKRESGSTTE